MRIAITGTPGTGKSTLGKLLSKELNLTLYNLTEVVKKHKLFKSYDIEREAYEVDLEKLSAFFKDKENFILEGLLAHTIPVDYLIILRTNPEVLRKRLKLRDYSREKVEENVEAEKLAVIATEAIQRRNYRFLIHLDTSNKTPEDILKIVKTAILKKEEIFEEVDWLEPENQSYKDTNSL